MAGEDEETMDSGSTAGAATPPAPAPAEAPAASGGAAAPPLETTSPQLANNQIAEEPQETLTPHEQALKHDSWGTKVYHGVLDALGGGGDVSYSRDPKTGKMTATPVATGTGTQWKRMIAGALSSFAAAEAAAGTGPGSGARAAAAGIQNGFRIGQQRDQDARAHADQDYEAQQKAATEQAQLALLNHQIAKSTFDLGRAEITASVEDSERENNFEKVISDGGQGTHDMGVFPDFQSVIQAFKEAPELHDMQAGGRVVSIPHINAKGQVDGVRAAIVTPDWLNSKVNRELPITTRTYKNGKVEEQTFTVPPGTLTGQQYSQMVMAQSKDAIEDWTKTQSTNSETKLRTAEAAKDYAAADKDRSEAKALNEATTQGTLTSNAQQLVEGTMDPANLSKRSKTYDATLAAANTYSIAKYGRPFDVAKAAGDYKFATNPQTYNMLNYLNSLTGRDNQSGNLGTVVQMSDKLGRSKFPPLNKVELWAKLSAGHPDIAAYRAALLEVSDQVAKILQGGGTGSGTSDTKLKDAQALLDKDFNPSQIKATAETLRQLLANRKQEVIGDNRYLMQWHGQPAAPAGAAAELPAEASTAVKNAGGKPVTFANGQTWKWDNNQAVQVKTQ